MQKIKKCKFTFFFIMHQSKCHHATCRWSFYLFNLDGLASSLLNLVEEQIDQICATTLIINTMFFFQQTRNYRCTFDYVLGQYLSRNDFVWKQAFNITKQGSCAKNAHFVMQYFVCFLTSLLCASLVFIGCAQQHILGFMTRLCNYILIRENICNKLLMSY